MTANKDPTVSHSVPLKQWFRRFKPMSECDHAVLSSYPVKSRWKKGLIFFKRTVEFHRKFCFHVLEFHSLLALI